MIDCPSTNIESYTSYLKERLNNKNIKLVVEHKADDTYPVCSAASILAKVTRDREIERLKLEVKRDFGSGYPADPKTKAFLESYWNKFPEIFRKSWASYKRIARSSSQKGLGEY